MDVNDSGDEGDIILGYGNRKGKTPEWEGEDLGAAWDQKKLFFYFNILKTSLSASVNTTNAQMNKEQMV